MFYFRKTPSILRFVVCNTMVLMGMCGTNPGMTGVLKENSGKWDSETREADSKCHFLWEKDEKLKQIDDR